MNRQPIASSNIKSAGFEAAASLAHNLCSADHFDKQAGKPCLACEIERLEHQVGGLRKLAGDCLSGQPTSEQMRTALDRARRRRGARRRSNAARQTGARSLFRY